MPHKVPSHIIVRPRGLFAFLIRRGWVRMTAPTGEARPGDVLIPVELAKRASPWVQSGAKIAPRSV